MPSLRLQEVGVHVIASAEVLRETPLPHAVASYPLKEAAAAIRGGGVSLPEGAGRFVVSVDGTESEEDITALKVGRSCWTRLHRILAALNAQYYGADAWRK